MSTTGFGPERYHNVFVDHSTFSSPRVRVYLSDASINLGVWLTEQEARNFAQLLLTAADDIASKGA